MSSNLFEQIHSMFFLLLATPKEFSAKAFLCLKEVFHEDVHVSWDRQVQVFILKNTKVLHHQQRVLLNLTLHTLTLASDWRTCMNEFIPTPFEISSKIVFNWWLVTWRWTAWICWRCASVGSSSRDPPANISVRRSAIAGMAQLSSKNSSKWREKPMMK